MARRVQHTMGLALPVGQSAPIDWEGGEGTLYVGGTFGASGTVALQQMAPDGNYYTLQNYATTTPISMTAAGTANFRAPAGKLSLLVAGAGSAINGYAVGIPTNAAG